MKSSGADSVIELTDDRVQVAIEVFTERGQHFVRLLVNGAENDRWGPYGSLDEAMRRGKRACEFAERAEKRQWQ